MKLISKHFIKFINIYIKIYFIIFIYIIFKLINKKILINQNKQNNNKSGKEIKIVLNSNNEKNLKKQKIKVGVIGLMHLKNVGNNLLKFSIYTQLKELNVEPYIIGTHMPSEDIRFLNRTTNLRIIKYFNEIKINDYDILMVNSDQTWRKWSSYLASSQFYDIAFLNFSKNWAVHKFIYGASIGFDYWAFSKETDKIAKFLLKNFTGISFREMSTVKFAKEHLGINSTFVLDPTMLIDKKYFIEIINSYKKKIKNDLYNLTEYFLTYKLGKNKNMHSFIKRVENQLNYKIFNIKLYDNDYIEKFLYGIYNCKGVSTNSYHATIFAILFNKPFVVFLNSNRGNGRFQTIKEVFGIKNRFFNNSQKPNLSLLNTPLKINYTSINYYRNISLEFLKKNLNI